MTFLDAIFSYPVIGTVAFYVVMYTGVFLYALAQYVRDVVRYWYALRRYRALQIYNESRNT